MSNCLIGEVEPALGEQLLDKIACWMISGGKRWRR
jgi:hypothetical protein